MVKIKSRTSQKTSKNVKISSTIKNILTVCPRMKTVGVSPIYTSWISLHNSANASILVTDDFIKVTPLQQLLHYGMIKLQIKSQTSQKTSVFENLVSHLPAIQLAWYPSAFNPVFFNSVVLIQHMFLTYVLMIRKNWELYP